MVDSVVTVWNMALSAVGGRALVSSETETGREADLCRLWYPLVRDTVLKSASWPSTKKYARLALLASRASTTDWGTASPAPGWQFAYGAPADMLAPRYLASYARFDRSLWGGNVAIMCNEEEPVLHYSAKQEDPTRWDAGLVNAVVQSLAASLAKPISGKDTLADRKRADATEAILLARTEFANESDDRHSALPSWVAASGYEGRPHQSRFFWPIESFSGLAV